MLINRLQKRRVMQFARHEFEKARWAALLHSADRKERREMEPFLRALTPTAQTPSAGQNRMHPEHCVGVLKLLRESIEAHGLDLEKDPLLIQIAYGQDKSGLAARLIFLYEHLKSAPTQSADTRQKHAPSSTSNHKQQILATIDCEIEIQQSRLYAEELMENDESTADYYALPPESTMEKILRYCTAFDREFDRLLARLLTIRKLREAKAS